MKRYLSLFIAFCVAFTALPFMAGDLDANAAVKKKKSKTAKTITLYASATGQSTAYLSWNKIKKQQKGYAVFRNGVPIAHLGKRLSFSDSGLSAGTAYTYQIKTYKTKKVKQWYNKATGKWQKKKPKKKFRGGSKKIVTYTYKKPSRPVTIRTAAAPKPQPQPSSSSGGTSSTIQDNDNGLATPTGVKAEVNDGYIRITWNAVSGATGYKLYRQVDGKTSSTSVSKNRVKDTYVTDGKTYIYSVKAVKNGTYSAESNRVTVKYGSGSSTQPSTPSDDNTETVLEKKTVTDYLGVTRTFSYISKGNEKYWYGDGIGRVSNFARWDKTVDGEFTSDTGHEMVQYQGATFDKTEIANVVAANNKAGDGKDEYPFTMYNGNASKLSVTPESDVSVEPVNTYYCESGASGSPIYPMTAYYYNKNGKRIAKASDDGKVYKTSTSGATTTVTVAVNTWGKMGSGLGIYTGTIKFNVVYDNKPITSFVIDTAYDSHSRGTPTDGMTGERRLYLDVARAAIAKYGEHNLDTDLKYISKYIYETYKYGDEIKGYGASNLMICGTGAAILETWAIYRYNQWGFCGPGSSSVSTHQAFRLNSTPTGVYYEAEGDGDANDFFYDDDGNLNPYYGF